jgi:PAS domain S-box-containing protein
MPKAVDDTDAVPVEARPGLNPDLLPEEASDLIVRADAQGLILYVSAGCRALGYEPEDLIGHLAADFVHPDDRAKLAANTASLFVADAAGRPVNREHRFRCKDGSWVWLEGRPTVLPSADGRLGDVLNRFRDVTARRAMGEALRKQVWGEGRRP